MDKQSLNDLAFLQNWQGHIRPCQFLRGVMFCYPQVAESAPPLPQPGVNKLPQNLRFCILTLSRFAWLVQFQLPQAPPSLPFDGINRASSVCRRHADDEKPRRGFNCGKPCVQPRERLNVGIEKLSPIYRTLEGFGCGNGFACTVIITTEHLRSSYFLFSSPSPG